MNTLTLTRKHKHSHMNEKQTTFWDIKCFFLFSFFHFWKDEVQKLDNQSDDEVDIQMHGVSLGQ